MNSCISERSYEIRIYRLADIHLRRGRKLRFTRRMSIYSKPAGNTRVYVLVCIF